MIASLIVACTLPIYIYLGNLKTVKLTPDEISINDLKKYSDSGMKFYLLDVRTIPEFNAGHIAFTDDLIPYDQLEQNKRKLPSDRETTIYLFCRTGRRSGIATAYLRSIGYKNSYNVVGGIIAWEKAGYKVVTGPLRK